MTKSNFRWHCLTFYHQNRATNDNYAFFVWFYEGRDKIAWQNTKYRLTETSYHFLFNEKQEPIVYLVLTVYYTDNLYFPQVS